MPILFCANLGNQFIPLLLNLVLKWMRMWLISFLFIAIYRFNDGNATIASPWIFWYYTWRSSVFTVIDWRRRIIMSTYYLAFRPYAELRSICQSPSAPSSLLLARSGWSNAGVYRAGPETDFFSFASGLSLEVQKMGAEINKCMSSKTSSFLLLLTSGGLVVYLLLR